MRETRGLKRLDGCRTRPWKGARTFGCPACGVLVTTGDFDWALGRIEQDDSYAG